MMARRYSDATNDSLAYLSLTLKLRDPVEIEEFARVFAGLGGLFDDSLRDGQPQGRGHACLYVREVYEGSIVAHLVPSIPDMIGYMDNASIGLGFGAMFSGRIRRLVTGRWLEKPVKSDLKPVVDTLLAVATDPDGSATLETVILNEDGEKRQLVATFTTSEARRAIQTVEDQRREIETTKGADDRRVLMVFERPGRSAAKAGKATGERAVIEAIGPKPLGLIYASDLAQRRIKDSFRTENVFQQGFVVDVNLETRNGRPVAYRVTELHDVIDLPDDGEDA